MTSSKDHQDHLASDNRYSKHIRLGAAARRYLLSLVSMMLEVETKAFLKKSLSYNKSIQALHVDCGRGDETYLMSTFLDDSCWVHGIDADIVQIESAKKLKQAEGCAHLLFTHKKEKHPSLAQTYDLIYIRFLDYGVYGPQRVITHLFKNLLKDGGMLIVEMLQASKYKSYPYNYAFVRSMDLIERLEKKHLDITNPKGHITHIFHQLSNHPLNIYETHPTFIPAHCKQIPSLLMEYLAQEIAALNTISKEELDALMLELRRYEQEPGTLISRPRFIQISTVKRSHSYS